MRIIRILIKLKWLGLIGILGTIIDITFLSKFILFFLLGFIEIFSNFTAFSQSILQLISYPYMFIKYRSGLPTKKDNICKIKYSLPFEGCWFVANGGVDKNFSHSWAIWPQRYAYDFLIIDEESKTYIKDNKNLSDYYCHGKNILAPAEGQVVKIMDKYPESNVFGDGTVECKAGDIRGNYIVIRHSDKEYSTIAHIMTNSILVKPGQKVTRGQVIAKCGNSGNTSEPHIHFQINDGKGFFYCAGLPIKFENVFINENSSKIISEYIHRGHLVENG